MKLLLAISLCLVSFISFAHAQKQRRAGRPLLVKRPGEQR
jgi:hypothetical protein